MSEQQAGVGPHLPPQAINVGSGQTVRLQQVITAAGSQNVNVISTRGQQFVITSQVPGLTQVITTIASTNPALQTTGATRIINLTPSRRVSLVGVPQVAGRTGTLPIATSNSGGSDVANRGAVSLVAIGQPAASSHPTLVSTLSSPPRQRPGPLQATTRSPGQQSSSPRKRMRLSDLQERPPPNEEVAASRCFVQDYKSGRMRELCEQYAEHAAELFFLQAGGNMMDYHTWRKKPPTPQFLHFLRTHRLDPDDDDEDLTQQLSAANLMQSSDVKPSLTTSTVPAGQSSSLVSNDSVSSSTSNFLPSLSRSPMQLSDKCSSSQSVTKLNTPRLHTRQHSISAVYDNSIGSQEQIAEKAKQEAYVMQRIVELQKEGLWSEKRLPKVQEPPRAKAHWDYLLEEMVWLAADFAQERKWKKAAAKKCAKNVQKYFQDKTIQAQRAEKVQELKLKKIAGCIAKEVKSFWNNIEKLVEFKQQTRLEEKRKKALDQHLSFIVDQTEKYSTWLTESMNKSVSDSLNVSVPASVNSSRRSSPTRQITASDDDFDPNQSSTDDEETIAKEEEENSENHNHSEEIELLKRESELPLEDLLKELPGDYLDTRDKLDACDNSTSEKSEDVSENEEFKVEDVDAEVDDEETIQEQEAFDKDVDHEQEISELKAEGEMSIEELMAKYGGGLTEEQNGEADAESRSDTENETEDEVSESESEEEKVPNSNEDDLDLKTLMNEKNVTANNENEDNETAHKEINDVAALAESIQPKGNTLSSTSVVTPVPFLLKHTLREYQHIGLDWLVTMFDRKLNGILADEMGLGKTIQTISLLAHLACEKANWGPHLIIVPTSVMLNWEMELKKWCPSFKILTYYGTQKERKQKRTGWTKPNAFHVCITSYKLVIQDHQSFRRKKWKYLILDEAQNIKNFKSQRWQLLLNFQTQRRLLLTGTPLQNNLMELWSLMHFLMPDVFQSHKEFKEWFSNPVTGMIEGNSEYNESIIKRLHKVLRPFLLRRLKTEVEKQLPKKYEHVVMCRLSKRQRYLYDDFMSRAKTKETLASGNLLSVINVLMQLRKVCNHPNLFEVRPTISPFQMEGITFNTASLVYSALDYDPMKHVDLFYLNLLLLDLESCLNAFVAHRIKKYQAPKRLIEEIDSRPDPAPRCPAGKVKIHVRLSPSQHSGSSGNAILNKTLQNFPVTKIGTSPLIRAVANQAVGQGLTLRVAAPGGSSLQGYSVQLVQHQGGVKAIPVPAIGTAPSQQQQVAVQSNAVSAVQGMPTKSVDGVQRISVPAGFAQLVQTSMGRHILLTSSPQVIQTVGSSQSVSGSASVMTASGQRLTVLSKPVGSVSTTTVTTSVNRLVSTTTTVSQSAMKAPASSVGVGLLTSSVSTTSPLVAGTTTITTAITPTTTKTSVAVTQPLLTALVQQSINNTSSTTVPYSSMAVLNELKSLVPFRVHREQEFDKDSVFYLPELEVRRRKRRKEKLNMIHNVNQRRCAACPIYGSDLVEAIRMVDLACTASNWKSSGYVHCLHAHRRSNRPEVYWTKTEALASSVHTNEQYIEELRDLTSRFVLFVPAVSAPQPKLHVSHPPPHCLWEQMKTEVTLHQELSPRCALLHPIASAMVTQFPDPRLIQYDCGKLQVLDRLLRELKVDHHRVLIFTQMTRMLDVLESFLNFHGHIYLRLDGTTRVDQRQMLMERFNADRRIFCFILSTRSGGIGVNLTGADTVIFYDSDWNPTMDAQAQDRCHRIGQTRDVHIYRLVSEMTVEENILKKANQKRLLGDLAIEGGNFTTAYFKKSTIQDLFNVDVGENDPGRRLAEVVERDSRKERQKDENMLSVDEKNALGALESALAAAEDETDVQAARTAKAEAAAELAEFDESIPLEEGEAGAAGEPEMSKAEMEVENLIQQLRPVELYAMSFVEETDTALSAEQLAAAEAEIEHQKREWEMGRLQAMKEEEERRLRLADEDDDSLLTFSRVDSKNQNWRSSDGKEQMPVWCPPTPPQDDNDMYIDYYMGFLYEQSTMSEAQLPPVYVKKEYKRFRLDPTLGSDRDVRRPHKIRHREESIYAPRSLFDRPSAALLKMRRDIKLQKFRGMPGGIVRPAVPIPGLKPPTTVKTVVEAEHVPDWLIYEDMVLLQAVQSFLELPLNLMILSPAHTPNWDMVSDIVNNVSRTYRSPKQCRSRYESVIVPREEGKIFYDTNPKKQKKTKGIYKVSPQTKTTRPLRTSQLYVQDNNLSFTQLFAQRFETIRNVSKNRKPTVKPLLVNSSLRNPKHAAILSECGINYDSPLSPLEVAANRAKRIQNERNALLQQRQAAAAKAATPAVPTPQSPVTSVPAPAAVVPAPPTPASPSQGQAVASSVSVGSTTTISSSAVSTITAALRTQRPVTALTVQDMVAGQVRSAATSSGAVVSVANLTRAQVQAAAQRFASANLVTQGGIAVSAATSKGVTAVTSAGGKTTITPAQLRLYQQQQTALLRQQQQRLAPQQIKVQGQPGQKVSVALTSGGVTTMQVTQAQQQRAQFIKQGAAVAGKQTLTRPMSESEMAAMLKRQQQLVVQQQKGQVQVAAQAGLTPAQILAQAGLQVQQSGSSGQTQVATLVKTVSAAGGSTQSMAIPMASMTLPQVKAALAPGVKTATQQQMRQLALQQQILQQRKLPGQKVAQLTQVTNKSGVPTQLIVQSQKTLPATMTVQQIQQVIKHVQPQGVQQITHVSGGQTVSSQVTPGHVYSLAKGPQASGGTLQTRVVPVASAQQGLKQIQVVTAAAPGVRTSVPNVTIDSAGRPQVSVASTLASALAGTIKVAPSASSAQQQAIISQVTAALQGQQMSVAVRQASQSPVRIQPSGGTTPLVAVAVQQSGTVQHAQPSNSHDTAQ